MSIDSSASNALPPMQYSRLGNSGLQVSRICLGCMTYGSPSWREWVLPEEPSRPFIKRALELGINFFDTADMYSEGKSEEVLGAAIKDFTSRDSVVLTSKVYFPMPPKGVNDGGLSRKHILQSVEASLKRLGTDYIDLYQIHRFDKNTPIEETMSTLNDLVRAGKVRYIGASSMYAWQFAKMQHVAEKNGWTQFVSMQNHYNLVYREEEREMNPYCVSEGVGILPWSPLARGFLAGNRKQQDRAQNKDEAKAQASTLRSATDAHAHMMYYSDSDYKVVERVEELAKQKGCNPAQLSLAWLLHQPGVTAPIIGASKMYQLEDAVKSLAIKLTPEERARLEEPYVPHRVLGHT